jgi:hypothetical protein
MASEASPRTCEPPAYLILWFLLSGGSLFHVNAFAKGIYPAGGGVIRTFNFVPLIMLIRPLRINFAFYT